MIPTLVELLRRRAESHPARGFGFLGDGVQLTERLSYAALDRAARALAVELAARRIPASGRALLVYPPGLELVRAIWGCVHAGVIAVPVPPPVPARLRRTVARLRAVARDARPDVVLTSAELEGRLGAVVPELDGVATVASARCDADPDRWQAPATRASDVAVLQYTSGSTRDPRGVVLTHANLLHNLGLLRAFHLEQDDLVMVHWLPLHHDMGLIRGMFSPLEMGGDCVMMAPLDFVQRPLRWLEAVTRFGATTTGAPGFGYELVARHAAGADLSGIDLARLRVAFCSAEPVRAATIDRFVAAFGPRGFRRGAFRPAYGLAEATVAVTGETGDGPREVVVSERALRGGRVVPAAGDERALRLVSCGRPLGGQEVLIVDDEGHPAPPDRVGEIWLRGPSVAAGYFGREEETRAVFGAQLADGRGPYLRTGDQGWRAPDGGLVVTGRLRDVIIVRGENHHAHELEATVERAAPLRPGCSAAFAVEEEGTEAVVVVAEPAAGAEPAATLAAMRRALAEEHDLRPLALVLVAAGDVPKTASGKVQRSAARQLFLDRGFQIVSSHTAPSRSTFVWPRFAAHLAGAAPGRERLLGFLASLEPEQVAARPVLASLFSSAHLIDGLAALAPHIHHVGMVAPPGLSAAQVGELLAASPFRDGLRTFASEIFSREVSARFGRPVTVTIVQGGRGPRSPERTAHGVEVFVVELADAELAPLLADETGCHVALGLLPGATFEEVRALLHSEGLAGGDPSVNLAVRARVLYIDLVVEGKPRRLELIAHQA